MGKLSDDGRHIFHRIDEGQIIVPPNNKLCIEDAWSLHLMEKHPESFPNPFSQLSSRFVTRSHNTLVGIFTMPRAISDKNENVTKHFQISVLIKFLLFCWSSIKEPSWSNGAINCGVRHQNRDWLCSLYNISKGVLHWLFYLWCARCK